MSGMGFELDREALEARQTGDLLRLAYDRGFRLLGSVIYLNAESLPPYIGADSPQLQQICQLFVATFLNEQDYKPWHFVLTYQDKVSGAAFIEFHQ